MNWFGRSNTNEEPLDSRSTLYNESTFYDTFVKDVLQAKEEVIIECPFITTRRLQMLKPVFEKLVNKGVKVFILTRYPHEHDEDMVIQSEAGIRYFEVLGVQVFLVKGGHHRKVALIDRKILWEGSLNILSQSNSREFMRRIESRKLTQELFTFLHFDRIIK